MTMITPAQWTGPRHSPWLTLSSPRPAHSSHSSAQRRHPDTAVLGWWWSNVVIVHTRASAYILIYIAYNQHFFYTAPPLMLPLHQHWSDHPEMCSVSSSEFAVSRGSMSHSLTVTSVTTLIPSPMSESVTGTIWRLGRDRFCLHTLENVILWS